MKKVAKTKAVKRIATLGLVGIAVISSPVAVADDSGWLGGFNIGQTRAEIDNAQIANQLSGSGFAMTSIAEDNRDTGFKIFGGHKFNKNFALESGYFNLGKFGFTSTTLPAGTLTGKIKLQGFNLDAVGMLPVTDKFSVFGRVGAQYAQAKDSFSGTGAVVPTNPSSSKSAINYKAGLGAQYDFTDSVGLRGELERYRINDGAGSHGDINMYSVGLVFMLDKEKPAHAPVMQAAAPPPLPPVMVMAAAVAAPTPAPVMVIVPVKTKTEQYCSILDIQFEIKQDNIQREDKEKLAVVGTFMNKYPNTTAVIEGHTDNVGTPEYNQKLSQQRADSVVSYLTDELHVAPSRLTAVGYGITRPIADNATDEGKQKNRRIDAVIACATDIAGLKVLPARITMAMEMEFDPYKSNIEPQYLDDLRKVADFMKANPSVTATVEGHANKYLGIGADKIAVNPGLAAQVSQSRAQNVVDHLVNNLGISRSRLSTEAYGNMGRVSYGTTLEGQQENRRVNIIINYTK